MSEQSKLSFPSPSRFKRLNAVLSRKEKIFLYLAIIILLGSLFGWAFYYYFSSTEVTPDYGGEYTEGVIGQHMFINPLLAQSNEVDTALCQLIFSSLLTYDNEGNLKNDLTESYEIQDEGRRYKFKIKEGVKWHDKTELTAHDIAFTISLIQDSAYKSPLKSQWKDIRVSAEDNYTIVFELAEPYAPFLNKLTFGVLPKHIFEGIPAKNFLTTNLNLEPVGSGPYEFASAEKDAEGNWISIQLLANPEYHYSKPYLEKINFNYYSGPSTSEAEERLFEAYSKKKINGFGAVSYDRVNDLNERRDTYVHTMNTSRYFAVFMNQTKSVSLAKKEIREALMYATDREEIINQVFNGYASKEVAPILQSYGEFSSTIKTEDFPYDPNKAEEILNKLGWEKGEDGIYKKDGEVLELSIVTTKWPALEESVGVLKKQWERIGVRLNVTTVDAANFQQNFIKTREYQSILYGHEYFGNDPDPYEFWHSSGKKDPGKNITVYDNSNVDQLLVDARKELDTNKRKEKYAEFEKLVVDDRPTIFLFSPHYVYIVNDKIKGINTSTISNNPYRFVDAKNWFIKTKRVKKQD